MENRAASGFNIVCLSVAGKDLSGFQNEAGGHRIQRVPPNERRGRVHTSTVTVAVTSGSEIDGRDPLLQRAEADFRVEWFSGSGAGGQHRKPISPDHSSSDAVSRPWAYLTAHPTNAVSSNVSIVSDYSGRRYSTSTEGTASLTPRSRAIFIRTLSLFKLCVSTTSAPSWL